MYLWESNNLYLLQSEYHTEVRAKLSPVQQVSIDVLSDHPTALQYLSDMLLSSSIIDSGP